MKEAAATVQLKPETLQAFTAYILEAEAGMDAWPDCAERSPQLWSGQRPVKVPDGLIHDWIGAISIPGAGIEKTLALIQDYDHHKDVYRPDVMDSRLISREGDDFKVYLRLLKKKVKTVILDTDHDVRYYSLDPARVGCRSYTTRICEVDDAGKSAEKARPPDTGHGFLWRLNSYWRFQEKDGCVLVECRAISLTRNVPKGLGWIIEPIIMKLPRESLGATLEATRRAILRPPAC